MRNRLSANYSQLVIMRGAFEYELHNVLKFEDRQEVFRIINYFEDRIKEIKEEEALWNEINSKGLNERSICE